MDRVLGLSMTSEEIRWVLVDGVTGEGATLERGALDIPDAAEFDAETLLTTLPDGADLDTIGLSWSPGAEEAASKVCAALDSVIAQGTAVTGVQATEALARGIAQSAGYDFLAVCTVEPGETVVVTINAGRVTTQPVDGAEGAVAAVRGMRPSPDAVYVLGSGDTETLAAALREATTTPFVLTAADGELALARGAALAGAQAVTEPDAPVVTRAMRRTRAVSAILAGALVTFIVSLSLAVVPHWTPGPQPPVHHSTAAGPQDAPKVPPAVTPAHAQPAHGVEPAFLQPLYGPPDLPVTPSQPRLRDRIKEKIPLLNRF